MENVTVGGGRRHMYETEHLLNVGGGYVGIPCTLSSTFLYEICYKKLEGEETGRKETSQ